MKKNKNKNVVIAILLAFVLLIGGAYALYDRLGQTVTPDQVIVHAPPQPTEIPAAEEELPAEESAQESGYAFSPAPDFHVYDRDGSAVHLSDFFGKPIVLNFWASWCGPCQSEMPDFNKKYAELGGDIHFVMINMTDGQRETVETASAFLAQNGYDLPVFFDISGEAAYIYEAYSLPTSYFISADGGLVAQAVGAIDAATLQECIDLITG